MLRVPMPKTPNFIRYRPIRARAMDLAIAADPTASPDELEAAWKMAVSLFSEFERDLGIERTRLGQERARANGRLPGRRSKVTDAQVRQMAAAVKKGESLRSIGARFGLSPTGVQKAIERVERKAAK